MKMEQPSWHDHGDENKEMKTPSKARVLVLDASFGQFPENSNMELKWPEGILPDNDNSWLNCWDILHTKNAETSLIYVANQSFKFFIPNSCIVINADILFYMHGTRNKKKKQ